MKAVGIIVEYNPFHNGHAYHIAEAKRLSKETIVTAIMSGSFVQRGEPAVFDKWLRAEMALLGGADLVIELPTLFALRSAQYFAEGAIKLLNSLGCISHVCFGAEESSPLKIEQAAQVMELPQITTLLTERMRKFGISYAKALADIISEQTNMQLSPNNILAIEYLRAIRKHAPSLKPLPIFRTTSYHSLEIDTASASASAIRNALALTGSLETLTHTLPTQVTELIKETLVVQQGYARIENLIHPLLVALRLQKASDLIDQAEMIEGLHNKIQKASLEATSWEIFFEKIITKRYTPAKIRRILLYILLHVSQKALQQADHSGPLYARVLAFNNRGRSLLKTMKQTSTIPTILKTSQFLSSKDFSHPLSPLQAMLAVDVAATDLYTLCLPPGHLQPGGQDYRRTPLYLP